MKTPINNEVNAVVRLGHGCKSPKEISDILNLKDIILGIKVTCIEGKWSGGSKMGEFITLRVEYVSKSPREIRQKRFLGKDWQHCIRKWLRYDCGWPEESQ